MSRLIVNTSMTLDAAIHQAMWGHGTRPFEGDRTIRLDLVAATAFDSGVTLLRYQPAVVS